MTVPNLPPQPGQPAVPPQGMPPQPGSPVHPGGPAPKQSIPAWAVAVISVLAVLVLAGGGLLAWKFLGSSGSAPASTAKPAPSKSSSTPAPAPEAAAEVISQDISRDFVNGAEEAWSVDLGYPADSVSYNPNVGLFYATNLDTGELTAYRTDADGKPGEKAWSTEVAVYVAGMVLCQPWDRGYACDDAYIDENGKQLTWEERFGEEPGFEGEVRHFVGVDGENAVLTLAEGFGRAVFKYAPDGTIVSSAFAGGSGFASVYSGEGDYVRSIDTSEGSMQIYLTPFEPGSHPNTGLSVDPITITDEERFTDLTNGIATTRSYSDPETSASSMLEVFNAGGHILYQEPSQMRITVGGIGASTDDVLAALKDQQNWEGIDEPTAGNFVVVTDHGYWVYVEALSGSVYRVEDGTPTLVNVPPNLYTTLFYAGGDLYFDIENLSLMDTQTGQRVWQLPEGALPTIHPSNGNFFTVSGNRVTKYVPAS